MSTKLHGSIGWCRCAASCSAKHHARHHPEHRGQLRALQVGLDQQHLGPPTLGQRQRQVDRGGGLAFAGPRARHHDHLRPAGLEDVVAQHAEVGGARRVGVVHQHQPRVAALGVLGRQVMLREADLRRRAGVARRR
jgi:hypothetical protein